MFYNGFMNTAASATLVDRKDALRATQLSLAAMRPVEECHPEECPLYQVRKMKFTRRVEWFKALSENESAYLVTYDEVCLNVKLIQPSAEPDLHRAN